MAGKSFHLAPVLRIQRIPSRHSRSSAGGRPPLGFLRRLGSNGSIFLHCSSVNIGTRTLIGLPPKSDIRELNRHYNHLVHARYRALQASEGFATTSSKGNRRRRHPLRIPYMMHSMDDPAKNVLGNMPLEKAGVQIVVGKVVTLNTDSRDIILDSGEKMTYERLVLATGTDMILPPVPGIDKNGVYTVRKSMSAMTLLRRALTQTAHVAIIGGGFIGAEFADELSTATGTEVHLVELLPKILTPAFDDEFCHAAADILKSAGVHIHTGCRVTAINGDGRVASVTVDGSREIPAEAVLVCVGAKYASQLAKAGGLALAEDGSIWVDEYMRTSAPGVFAVGDCAVKRDFFTRKAVPVWLASTATAEARTRYERLRSPCAASDSRNYLRFFYALRRCDFRQCRYDLPNVRARRLPSSSCDGGSPGSASRFSAGGSSIESQTHFRGSIGYPPRWTGHRRPVCRRADQHDCPGHSNERQCAGAGHDADRNASSSHTISYGSPAGHGCAPSPGQVERKLKLCKRRRRSAVKSNCLQEWKLLRECVGSPIKRSIFWHRSYRAILAQYPADRITSAMIPGKVCRFSSTCHG